jgi:hypothetical protein
LDIRVRQSSAWATYQVENLSLGGGISSLLHLLKKIYCNIVAFTNIMFIFVLGQVKVKNYDFVTKIQ